MGLDLSGLTPALFIIGVIFIMLIGSGFSLGVLRIFQQKYRSAVLALCSSAIGLLLLILVVAVFF